MSQSSPECLYTGATPPSTVGVRTYEGSETTLILTECHGGADHPDAHESERVAAVMAQHARVRHGRLAQYERAKDDEDQPGTRQSGHFVCSEAFFLGDSTVANCPTRGVNVRSTNETQSNQPRGPRTRPQRRRGVRSDGGRGRRRFLRSALPGKVPRSSHVHRRSGVTWRGLGVIRRPWPLTIVRSVGRWVVG